uniref:Arrestin domain-containing protein 3-like n=1 Tax=Phallusia mammillata TaxID=59560 RepID=A0A6F9D650_9ASCI|nr:arrestin domain-containing protein 3-like [Phallusia mammillata]
MGKPKLYIEVNGNKFVYVPGDFVAGNLIIESNDSMDFKKIEVKFKGQAYVHWSESHGSGDNRRTEHYSARETYFKLGVVLMDSSRSPKIAAGRNVYPFQFQLPNNLPSSFEVSGGYVRYMIKGKIDRSGIFSDIKTMVLFTVLDCIDLNQNPQSLMPSSGCDSKQLCCWCCASGPIEGKVNTDRIGYVPGEFININASIENNSSTTLEGSSYDLVQMVTQHSTRKSRSFPVTLVSGRGPGCGSHTSAHLSNQRLQIPALPPSPLRFCNIIDIRYFVQLCVETPTCHINLRVPAPIEIGTIPLRSTMGNMATPPEVAETSFQPVPTAPIPNTTEYAPQPQPTNFQAPPPSYSAATAVNIETKATYEGTATTFAPQYNYYDWSQSAFTYNK